MSDTAELRGALRTILTDICTPESVVAAEPAGWNETVWRTLDDGGFGLIGVPEQHGGSGGTLTDAAAVLQELGRFGASVPYAEHALVASWLLSDTGKDLTDELLTAHISTDISIAGDSLNGTVTRVPWARAADRIALVVPSDDGAQVALVATSSVSIAAHRNVADEARDTVELNDSPAECWRISHADLEQVRLRLALSRAALIAGALERVVALSVRYTGEREQFGRPIGRFQAVQRHLVKLAEQAHLASMAVDAAAYGDRTSLSDFEVASAKIVASESASMAAAHAHQAHGAIGMTKEYELGQLSRRLWSWRDEAGSEYAWARELGARTVAAGADRLWPRVSAGVQAGVA